MKSLLTILYKSTLVSIVHSKTHDLNVQLRRDTEEMKN